MVAGRVVEPDAHLLVADAAQDVEAIDARRDLHRVVRAARKADGGAAEGGDGERERREAEEALHDVCISGLPFSTTKLARVEIGAPARVM